jgi:nicotinamide phosphoribosyltransferase
MSHVGIYTDEQLSRMTGDELIAAIKGLQDEENFIIMTDSYKMTHHLLYPKGIQEVYSYLESRGGTYPYSVMFGLNYYLRRYVAGVRITRDRIEEARRKNVEHFGFDCFDDTMWVHILEKHGGRLPLEIKAVPEGTPVAVKNVLMTIRNTDTEECAALTNITETLLMKLWATNTVATYARMMKALISHYWKKTSTLPEWLIDYMHHDFGYRGCSSEETARLMGAAALTSFKGTDTFGALTLLDKYYGCPMAGNSVIATEHSVVCSFGKENELDAYGTWIKNVPTGILSLVSDTWDIYNVCRNILPHYKQQIMDRKNPDGTQAKVVVRPDSGDPVQVLFGYSTAPTQDGKLGVFGILFEEFGYTVNEKGYKVLPPYIGVLQGDGVSLTTVASIYRVMDEMKISVDNLVFGSGGKYLQAHDRDEAKYAIKATHVVVDGQGMDIFKDPVTDAGKRSKRGYLKLVKTGTGWKDFKTVESGDPDFEKYEDVLETVFLNGQILKDVSFDQVRKNAELGTSDIDTIY